MGKWQRNPFPYPQIQAEEKWEKPLVLPGYEYDWEDKASTHDRLYNHNTLASIRQNCRLHHPCAPKDSLDIMLTTVYDQSRDSFLPKALVFVQPDMIGRPTYKLLRNVRYVPDVVPARDLMLTADSTTVPNSKSPEPGTVYYGLRIGGLKVRKSVHSVKLGISSNHSATSNPGYSRKLDGTLFTS